MRRAALLCDRPAVPAQALRCGKVCSKLSKQNALACLTRFNISVLRSCKPDAPLGVLAAACALPDWA